MTLRQSISVPCVIFALAGGAAPGQAQKFNAELYRPGSPGDQSLLSLQTAELPPGGTAAFSARTAFADAPLVGTDTENGRRAAEVIANRLIAEIALSYSFGSVEVWGALPAVLFQDSSADLGVMLPVAADSSGLGDLRLGARWRFYGEDEGLAVALSGVVTAPTSVAAELFGDKLVTFTPTLVSEVRTETGVLALNAGVRIRDRESLGDLRVGSAFVYGLGGSWVVPFARELSVIAELHGEVGAGALQEAPVEVRGGFRYRPDESLASFGFGYGRGVARGYGAPQHRAFFSMDYQFGRRTAAKPRLRTATPKRPPTALDGDGDGIVDKEDACPTRAEDFDGHSDVDGCPDPDNDGDGLLDAKDRCPMAAEDKDGHADSDGCPDPDNDGDGILDQADKCPGKAEVVNGIDDADGCPDQGRVLVKVVGNRLKLTEPILFERRSAVLRSSDRVMLAQIALVLLQNEARGSVRIEAHTDSRGRKSLRLSRRRAEEVKKALVQLGVSAEKLKALGLGGKKPVAKSGTSRGRAQNPRIEFVFVAGPQEPAPARGQP